MGGSGVHDVKFRQLNAALALDPAPSLGGGTKGEWQHPQPVLRDINGLELERPGLGFSTAQGKVSGRVLTPEHHPLPRPTFLLCSLLQEIKQQG